MTRRWIVAAVICAGCVLAVISTAFEKLAIDLAWLWVTAMAVMVGSVIGVAIFASRPRASRQHRVKSQLAWLARFATVEETSTQTRLEFGSEAYQVEQLEKMYRQEAKLR